MKKLWIWIVTAILAISLSSCASSAETSGNISDQEEMLEKEPSETSDMNEPSGFSDGENTIREQSLTESSTTML